MEKGAEAEFAKDLSTLTSNTALCLKRTGLLKESKQYYELAVERAKQASSQQLFTALNGLANLLDVMGDPREATKVRKQMAPLAKSEDDKFRVLINKAAEFVATHQFQKAREAITAALPTLKKQQRLMNEAKAGSADGLKKSQTWAFNFYLTFSMLTDFLLIPHAEAVELGMKWFAAAFRVAILLIFFLISVGKFSRRSMARTRIKR